MNYCIIAAAGSGERLGLKRSKALVEIDGKPMLNYSLAVFNRHPMIDEIIVVCHDRDSADIKTVCDAFPKVKHLAAGGDTRAASVQNGLRLIKGDKSDIVLIHNAANPLVDEATITNCIEAARLFGAAIAAQKCNDTLKEADGLDIIRTVNRTKIWRAQTPQAFRYDLLSEAIKSHGKEDYTDESALIEKNGTKIKIVECSCYNFKITTRDELKMAQVLLKETHHPFGQLLGVIVNNTIGLGHDSHKFDDRPKKLVLGGYEVAGHRGLEANSDGDVVLHSLCNAIS